MKNLTELANRYNSDKGDAYKCAHGYTQHYQPIFEKLAKAEDLCLLEIGLNRDSTNEVPSLRMYRDFFGANAKLCGMDIRPEFQAFEQEGFIIFIGDQGSPNDLAECAQFSYSIVIDDGSHASSHQQITLRELWQTVRPGGFYVIEDLHYQPFGESCPKSRFLCEQWMLGNAVGSEYIEEQWARQFISECQDMALLPSFSKLHDPELTRRALFIAQKK